ncbi:MAG: hypothetical protein RLO52_21370 [Sandaracinaceae bacterium]
MGHLRGLVFLNLFFGLANVLSICLVPALMMNGRDDGVLDELSTLAITPLMLLLGVAHLYIARQMHRRTTRLPQTLLAVLYLAAFPVGTIFGAYALWVIWSNDESAEAFS